MLTTKQLNERLAQTNRLWLFLDYDGTLADFAPTPEHVEPDPAVVNLLTALVQAPHIRVAVVSGRSLPHVQTLLPVSNLLLAGTYGIELRTFAGERIDRAHYADIRPPLDTLKPQWARLIANRDGFFLEDKRWALALHARFAEDGEAEEVLNTAQHMITEVADPDTFRVLGGHKFMEIGPRKAHKGRTVEYLLEQFAWVDALPLYMGDDDKDEEAFGVIKAHGGIAIVVAPKPRDTVADYHLESPQAARSWLKALPARLAGAQANE